MKKQSDSALTCLSKIEHTIKLESSTRSSDVAKKKDDGQEAPAITATHINSSNISPELHS